MQPATRRSVQFQIGLATFGILLLELALIRWTSQQVRVFAYFNNLTLMAAFLGMGLGVAIGDRRPSLQHWTLPALTLLSVLLGLSERLRIVYLRFPDLSISLWGGEGWPNAKVFVSNLLLVLVIFILVLFSIIFWMTYEQAGSSMTLFADRLTRNQIFGWDFPSSGTWVGCTTR